MSGQPSVQQDHMTTNDKLQWAGIIVSILVGVGSLFVAWQAKEISREQADAAKEANARASGRIPAKVILEASLPDSTSLPKELRKPIFGTELTTFYADNPEKMIALNHRIVLRNVGDEPIEAIRITVAYDRGFTAKDMFNLIGRDGPNDPIITEQLHKEEVTLDQKLTKNEVVIVPLTKGLLHQMLQGQRGQTPDAERYGEFVVKSYGRIVGSSSYDGLLDEKYLRVRLLWMPKGFAEERVAKMVESFKPRIEIMKAAEKPKK
jgi:hypothetical protein